MSTVPLALAYLRQRPLGTLLNVLLLALGIATITALLLLGRQAEQNLTRGAKNVDFVVGAKGSPLQLILSAVYHLDAPTGNIPRGLLDTLRANRAVAEAVPLALGDSYQGYRIVGTEPAYVDFYGGALAEGRAWERPGELVVGHRVAETAGLGVGSEVVSQHGLDAEGFAHDEHPLTVVGVLAPGGTVLDGLLLTAVETVWDVHGLGEPHDDHGGDHEGDAHDDHAGDEHDDHAGEGHAHGAPAPPPPPSLLPPMPGAMPGAMPGGAPGAVPAGDGRDLTAILVRSASPIATALLPRQINAETTAQAAVPAQEIQRLLGLLGVGFGALRLFGGVLLVVAALSVFIALTTAMQARRYDLAVMRALGASRGRLLGLVLTEGLLLTLGGLLFGLALGHLAAEALGRLAPGEGTSFALTGFAFAPAELSLVALVLLVGLVASLVPALRAYRTDVAGTLAAG